MTKPPIRLVDDPDALASLRTNLRRVRAADGGYDALRGLSRLQAELQLRAADPQAAASEGARGLALSGSKVWLGVTGALVIAAGSTFMALQPRSQGTPSAPLQPMAAQSKSAIEVAPDAGTPAARAHVTRDASLRREIEQLAEIRALLLHKPAAAYELAQRSTREFPDGALREERDALTALALSRLGERAEARKLAAAFVARYPDSPLRAVVEHVLEAK